MFPDTFSRQDAQNLLMNKRIFMFGDSNMRGIYKDLTWLLEYGTIISAPCLKRKNEFSHAMDRRLSNGELTASRDYVEVREYNHRCLIHYEFITRLYRSAFIDTIENLRSTPDFIIFNSCLWDLSRWGPNGVQEYKANIDKTLNFLCNKCPNSCIIFTTTLPPSPRAYGGFLTKEISHLNASLPFNVVEANHYVAEVCKKYNVNVIDLHYYLRFTTDYRTPDGIHWQPIAVRYINNIILTHLCIYTNSRSPSNSPLSYNYDVDSNNNDTKKTVKARTPQTGKRKWKRDNYYGRRYDFTTR